MGKAPIGAFVKIYYDGHEILVGECLRTPSGRIYVVMERRVQTRGKHVGRQHLGCIVAKEPPSDARVLPIHWYKRQKRRMNATP